MTSGEFTTIPLAVIQIERDSRQRRELKDIDELAESIRSVGLIHPPVVTREYLLIAGERRVTAMRKLGWTDCPVQWADTLDPTDLHLLELEENARRVDLTWQEMNDAAVAYHKLRAERDGFTVEQSADALNISRPHLTKQLLVHKSMQEEPALFENADGWRSAYNIASRREERKKATALQTVMTAGKQVTLPKVAQIKEAIPAPARRAEILNADFTEWAAQEQRLHNLIHCDFPYGVSVGDKVGQSGARRYGQYADSPEVYLNLLGAFTELQDNFIHPSAHLIFWFGQKFYQETWNALTAAGWRVDPYMLIWHKSDNAGIIPDPQRGGRRTYETAFFASRGDRKIVKPKAISVAAPTTKEFHTSEKPASVLSHFFEMVVDDTTNLLDPTAGSGMAVKVAEAMGAESALGLELDPEFAKTARINCKLESPT